MIHPDTALRLIDQRIGYGVFATAFIPKGTIIWVLDALDREMSADEVLALPDGLRAQVEHYAYVDAAGRYIFCWDFGRYMNHSCRPTSRGVGEAFEIAVRDIHPGEQLTCEYGVLNLSHSLACACGHPDCRGSVGPANLEALWPEWDAEAEEAYRHALHVAQPLLPYAKLRPADEAIAAGLREGRMVPLPSARLYRAPHRQASGAASGDGLWSLMVDQPVWPS